MQARNQPPAPSSDASDPSSTQQLAPTSALSSSGLAFDHLRFPHLIDHIASCDRDANPKLRNTCTSLRQRLASPFEHISITPHHDGHPRLAVSTADGEVTVISAHYRINDATVLQKAIAEHGWGKVFKDTAVLDLDIIYHPFTVGGILAPAMVRHLVGAIEEIEAPTPTTTVVSIFNMTPTPQENRGWISGHIETHKLVLAVRYSGNHSRINYYGGRYMDRIHFTADTFVIHLVLKVAPPVNFVDNLYQNVLRPAWCCVHTKAPRKIILVGFDAISGAPAAFLCSKMVELSEGSEYPDEPKHPLVPAVVEFQVLTVEEYAVKYNISPRTLALERGKDFLFQQKCEWAAFNKTERRT